MKVLHVIPLWSIYLVCKNLENIYCLQLSAIREYKLLFCGVGIYYFLRWVCTTFWWDVIYYFVSQWVYTTFWLVSIYYILLRWYILLLYTWVHLYILSRWYILLCWECLHTTFFMTAHTATFVSEYIPKIVLWRGLYFGKWKHKSEWSIVNDEEYFIQ